MLGESSAFISTPPYNTGNKDFIYNDHYVDKDDAFKHSKWLEYMYRRLILARDLLTQDGVIFVSIGEDEFGYLSVLMDEIFPGMKVGTFVWRRRSGSNDAKEWFLSVDHEYVVCYANHGFSFSGVAKSKDAYSNPDNDLRGDWVNGDLTKAHTAKQRPDAYYPIYNPKDDLWYACDSENVWRFASETKLKPGKKIRTKSMEQIIREDKVLWPQNDSHALYSSKVELLKAIEEGQAPRNLRQDTPDLDFWVGKKIGYGKPRYKRHLSELKRAEKPVSTWILPSSIKKEDLEAMDLSEVEVLKTGFTTEGTSQIWQMLGNKDFPYPKPLSLIQGLLQQATGPDDIVLDFFAGSGTTGQAVMSLNNEDGGDRKFILVSTTEATASEPDKNVCRDITRKRLLAAIHGYSYKMPKGVKEVEGLGGGFGYLRTKRLPMGHLHTDIQHDQIWYALQQLHGRGISPFKEEQRIQCADSENKRFLYAPELDQESLQELTKLVKVPTPVIIYSWQPGLLTQRLTSEDITFEKIPEFLVEKFGSPQ